MKFDEPISSIHNLWFKSFTTRRSQFSKWWADHAKNTCWINKLSVVSRGSEFCRNRRHCTWNAYVRINRRVLILQEKKLKAEMITLNLSVIYSKLSVVCCRALLSGWSCDASLVLLRCVWSTWKRRTALRATFEFRKKVCVSTSRTLHPFIVSRMHPYGWKLM